MKRRNFLGGLAGILAAGAAPAIIHDAMKIYVPKRNLLLEQGWSWPVPHPAGRGLTSPIIHGLYDVDNTTDSNKDLSEYQKSYHLRAVDDGITWEYIRDNPQIFPRAGYMTS